MPAGLGHIERSLAISTLAALVGPFSEQDLSCLNVAVVRRRVQRRPAALLLRVDLCPMFQQ